MKAIINKWKNKLGIPNWEITTKRISPDQIEYDGEDYFIGITRDFDNKKATIYHDVDLYEEAILHELLHIKFQQLDSETFEAYEARIDKKTANLLKNETL